MADRKISGMTLIASPENVGLEAVHLGTTRRIPAKLISSSAKTWVVSRGVLDPPEAEEGDRYIIPANATGVWAGHQDDIAEWLTGGVADDGAWYFSQPNGVVFVVDEGDLFTWQTGNWVRFAGGGGSGSGSAFNPEYAVVSGNVSLNAAQHKDWFLAYSGNINLTITGLDVGEVVRIDFWPQVNGATVTLDAGWAIGTPPPAISTIQSVITGVMVENPGPQYRVSDGGPYMPDFTKYAALAGAEFLGAITVPTQGLKFRDIDSSHRATWYMNANLTADRTVDFRIRDANSIIDFSAGDFQPSAQALTFLNKSTRPLMQKELGLQNTTVDGGGAGTVYSKANAQIGAITGLTVQVEAGKKYQITVILPVTADPVDGHQYSIDGSCTATRIWYTIKSRNLDTGVTVNSSRKTALNQAAGWAGSGSGPGDNIETTIDGVIKVNAAGNLQVKFAKNSAVNANNSTVGLDAFCNVREIA